MIKKQVKKVPAVPLVSAAARAFVIVEHLSHQRSAGLEELSREVGLAKPTVYRFLLTLQELGYVRRVDGDRWTMSLKLFTLGARALDHLDLVAAARPIAEEMADELGETVHMGVLDGDSAVYVLKIESQFTIRMISRVGRRMPLHCTAIGKVLLAFSSAEEREEALRNVRLVPFTKNSLTTRAELDAELQRIREQGYALDNEEREEDLRCIGAPVFDHTSAVVATISVSWPGFRYERGDESEKIRKVRDAAARISAVLGYCA